MCETNDFPHSRRRRRSNERSIEHQEPQNCVFHSMSAQHDARRMWS